MKTQPHPSDREVLAGLVEGVTYQNAENGFCVIRVKARSHRDLVTVVGHAATISAGEWITASGDWVNDRTHGQQFEARFLKTSEPNTVEDIEKYLSSVMIRGIGPTYAKKLPRASASAWTAESTTPRHHQRIAAWERQRNAAGARIKWMFTADKARAKMGPPYPVTSKES